jgi:hypothetical protein
MLIRPKVMAPFQRDLMRSDSTATWAFALIQSRSVAKARRKITLRVESSMLSGPNPKVTTSVKSGETDDNQERDGRDER